MSASLRHFYDIHIPLDSAFWSPIHLTYLIVLTAKTLFVPF